MGAAQGGGQRHLPVQPRQFLLFFFNPQSHVFIPARPADIKFTPLT